MIIAGKTLVWPPGWKHDHPTARYVVTPDGEVFRVDAPWSRQIAKHPDQFGYPCVMVWVTPRKRRPLRVHRAVCVTFHGPPPTPEHQVRHLNGIKSDNRPCNLAWGTKADNIADAIRLGELATGTRTGAYTMPERRPRGEQNGNSKLTCEVALAIARDPRRQRVIASAHGVSQALVSRVKAGELWSHVTGIAPRLGLGHG